MSTSEARHSRYMELVRFELSKKFDMTDHRIQNFLLQFEDQASNSYGQLSQRAMNASASVDGKKIIFYAGRITDENGDRIRGAKRVLHARGRI